MNRTSFSQKGFTIVELLIVIVVIGILAAITIVAYNGVQARATNVQTVSAVRAYYTAITAYTTENGSYPGGNGCLGPAAIYVGNPCYIGTGTYTHNAAANNALAPFLGGNTPQIPNGTITGSGITGSGIFYYPSGKYLGFVIKNATTCPSINGAKEAQSKVTIGSDIYCRISLTDL